MMTIKKNYCQQRFYAIARLGIYQNAEVNIFFFQFTFYLSNFSVYLFTPVLKIRNSAKPGNVSSKYNKQI